MLTRYNFELQLELIAENFYFNAARAINMPRGGNSRGNEIYFGRIGSDLREKLGCQQLILPSGKCPDSGIFGDFGYIGEDEVDWEDVKKGKKVVLAIVATQGQERYIQYSSNIINLQDTINSKTEIQLCLNSIDIYGEFFGIEYKASKNNSEESITVASFNSTCPCATKTVTLSDIKLIHNFPTTLNKRFKNDQDLKIAKIKLDIKFSMYYFIVNDKEENSRSVIKKLFICDGAFFAPNTPEEEAKRLSTEIKPEDLKINHSLYRVKLRYRPFFDARTIKAKGYGLYTSWNPKIPEIIREENERKALLNQIEKIKNPFFIEKDIHDNAIQSNDDNIIYLSLKESTIKKRAA